MNEVQSFRLDEDHACRFRRISGEGFRLALEITRRCDFKCNHCFVKQEQIQPTTDEILNLIRQAGKLNCRKIIITGGEPLLRDDLEYIIKVATSQGILADLNSNLFNITPHRVKRLKEAGLQEASVSLYGGRLFHDELTGKKGSFEMALKGIDYFREVNIAVDVHGGIWNNMLPNIEELIDIAMKHGVSSISFFSLILSDSSTSTDEYKLSPDLALETIAKARVASSIPVRTIGLRKIRQGECVMGNGIYGIGADLLLRPCLLSSGKNFEGIDLHKNSLKQALSIIDEHICKGGWYPTCNPLTERLKNE